YEKEAVRPEELAGFLRSLAERGYAGANVTLPHKEEALRLAFIADEPARAIGAANTIWLDNTGRLNASNTDAYWLMNNLNQKAPQRNRRRRPAMGLGAGGAAGAIVYGLIAHGSSRVLIANRTRVRAQALAGAFGPAVSVIDWDGRNQALAGCGLLVNATSLGMTGKEPLDIDVGALPDDAAVADIVYSPLETPLLGSARARGRQTVGGLGMLLYQAVPGFERWFGVRPEVTKELRAHV